MSQRFAPYPQRSGLPTHEHSSARLSRSSSRSGSYSSAYNSPIPHSTRELPPFDSLTSQLPPARETMFNGPSIDDWQQHSFGNDNWPVGVHQPEANTPLPAADVERVAGQLGVPSAPLLQFNTLSAQAQSLYIYGMLLQQKQQVVEFGKTLDQVSTKVGEATATMISNFQPTKDATKHMRRTARYYLLQPVRSYYTVSQHIKRFYAGKPHHLETDAYPDNTTVKNAIDKLIREYVSQARSNMRKVIWRFVRARTDLDTWGSFMMEHYWTGQRPKDIPLMVLARLALMRQIALPLADLSSAPGQSTGFWKKLNKELSALSRQYGDPMAANPGPAWEQWAKTIVSTDKAQFKEVPTDAIAPPPPDEDEVVDDDAAEPDE